MRKLTKSTLRDLRIVVALALVGVAVPVAISWFASTAETMCGNDILSSVEIAGTELRVVIFQRDCGATTGPSTHASIITTRGELPNKGGNVFAADTNHGAAPSGPGGGPELDVRVTQPQEISLSYHPSARVFRAEHHYEQIKIIYFASLSR